MPNPSLLDYQVKQVAAYLLSLRKGLRASGRPFRSSRRNAHDILRSVWRAQCLETIGLIRAVGGLRYATCSGNRLIYVMRER